MSRRHCLTLDLKDDPQLITEYRQHHLHVWPEITASLKASGIENSEIYLLGTRMVMILEVNDDFSFEVKAQADQADPKVREWEELMWTFQKPLPQAKPGEKWLLMEKIYQLDP